MSKPSRVRINRQWFLVPDPWYLVGHPMKTTIQTAVMVDNRAALGSCDSRGEEFEFVRDHASLEAFWSLALHEATEYLNDSLDMKLRHDRIYQLTEALGPFICQWFYAQLEASEEKPEESS